MMVVMAGKEYDNAMRDLVALGPDELCTMLLGRTTTGVEPMAEALAAVPLEADGVFRVPGERRLVHVEFQLRANRTDIHPRLVDYRSRIRRRYGAPPHQHVVVLRPPTRLPGIYDDGELILLYTAHHLWDIPARQLLNLGPLAALAVLGRVAPRRSRRALLIEVVETIRATTTGHERLWQVTHAATLANARIDTPTIEHIFRRWPDMPVDLSELPMVREYAARAAAKAAAEAAAEAAAKAAAEATARTTAELLNELLLARFGQLDPARRGAIDNLHPARRERLPVALLELRTLDDLDQWLIAEEASRTATA